MPSTLSEISGEDKDADHSKRRAGIIDFVFTREQSFCKKGGIGRAEYDRNETTDNEYTL